MSDPITFEPRKKKRWGTVALLGDGANSSNFAHCRFEHGGGATVAGIECKGMVSALRARGITFSQCKFKDHGRCDDRRARASAARHGLARAALPDAEIELPA